jgi:hypothetical protein
MKARLFTYIISAMVSGSVISACSAREPSPNDTQRQLTRTACTQVGLPPASSEVGDCVARMQAALSASPQ